MLDDITLEVRGSTAFVSESQEQSIDWRDRVDLEKSNFLRSYSLDPRSSTADASDRVFFLRCANFKYALMFSSDIIKKFFYVRNCFHEVSTSRTRAQETANVS